MNENNKFSERLLKNTQELVFLYNTNQGFKERFDKLVTVPKATFKGQSLRTYVKIITTISPRYHHFEKEVRHSSEKYSELLTSYYRDQREYPKLLQNLESIKVGKYSLPFSQEELKLMQELEKIPDDNSKLSEHDKKRKEEIVAKIHGHIDQKIEEEEKKEKEVESKIPTQPIPQTAGLKDIHGQPLRVYNPPIPTPHISISTVSTPSPVPLIHLPSVQIPPTISGALKTGSSNAQIATGGFLKNTLPKVFSGAGKGIASGLGFGSKAAVGLGGKAALLATGVGAPIAAALMIPGVSKKASQAIKYAAIGCCAILFFFLFSDINQNGSFFLPGTTIGEAAPLPPGYGGGDISSCKFTRSDQNPKETAFQSPRLLSYIQEASRLSGIPAAVLAAFMRVEVPSVAYKTDNSLASIGCPKSTTGALGLMQLQPKGTTGHDGPAIAQGAKLIGKTYDELTEADYCDLQKNIIMGAGFILKKMSYKDYGDGTRWDPAWTNDKKTFEVLVDGYYGCHLYGGPKDCTGPFNYAEDVWTSVQNCKPTSTTPPSLPPPGGDLRVAIENQFNVKFDNSSGFSNEVLGWAWEALARANSAPNFFPLLKPKGLVTITSSSGVGNTSGNTVFISTSAITAGKNFFEQNLIHELAHVIHGTRDDTTYSTQPAVSKDGGYTSGYAQGATADPDFACKTTNSKETNVQLDEDFAETVSYYINVNIPEQNYSKTNSCPPRSTTINPLSSGKYSEHIKYIKNILGGNNF
ncbi:MAG: hypothetical protein Q7R43_01895 [Candidatus Daviesbacteria bacterium]|nr:hypothetical protein [Candidatus Daviesbacteria bacterium]